MQFVAHIAYQIVRWEIAALIGLTMTMTLAPAAAVVLARGRNENAAIGWGIGCSMLIGFPLIFGLAFFGSGIAARLVHRYGVDGDAMVTGRFDTGSLYNEQPVIGYRVLIRRRDGGVTETGFRTDNFNVYPPRNEVTYPARGARFTARYLPDHPDDFVILTDDDSPWARGLRCAGLEEKVREAASKAEFSGGVATYGHEYHEARAAARAAGCASAAQD